jgi:hypothetical protein
MIKNIVEQKYFESMKQSSPERKLEIATELEDLILDIAKEGIKSKYSSSDKKFIKQELKKRIALKEELEKSWAEHLGISDILEELIK